MEMEEKYYNSLTMEQESWNLDGFAQEALAAYNDGFGVWARLLRVIWGIPNPDEPCREIKCDGGLNLKHKY